MAALKVDRSSGFGYLYCKVASSDLSTSSGNILIDWTTEQPVIRLQVCDEKGAVVLQQRTMMNHTHACRSDGAIGVSP
jgi:hypothetical protein